MRKEDLLKFYLNYRLFIFPAVVAFSSVILIVFVIVPQTIKLLGNQSEEVKIIKKSDFLEAKAKTLENYDSLDLTAKLNSALNSFPSDKDFASAIGLIQNLTQQYGFTIASLSLGTGSLVKNTGIQSYGINLSVIGPVNLLQKLLNDIEGSSRLMRISGVESTAGKDSSLVNILLNIDVLYSDATGDIKSLDAPLPELSEQDQAVLTKLVSAAPPSALQPTQTESSSTSTTLRGKTNPFE